MPSSEVSVTSGTWSLVIIEKRGMAGHDQDETARSERTWERERKELRTVYETSGTTLRRLIFTL